MPNVPPDLLASMMQGMSSGSQGSVM